MKTKRFFLFCMVSFVLALCNEVFFLPDMMTAKARTVNVTPTGVSGSLLGITYSCDKGNGTTAPAYNSSGKDLRIYAKGTITITCSDANMTSIVFNLSAQGKKRLAAITANRGVISTQTTGDQTVTWTGNANSVTFTVGDNALYGSEGSSKAGQLCFSNFDIDIPSYNYISSLSDLSNNRKYYIHTKDCSRGSLGVADGSLASTNSQAQGYRCNEASPFAILQFNGDYYLYSLQDNKFITNEGGETASPGIKGTHAISPYKRGNYFIFDFKSTGNTININNNPGLAINDWGTKKYAETGIEGYFDDGNQFSIEDIGYFNPDEALAMFKNDANETFTVNGINYSFNLSTNEATVLQGNYTGSIVIPSVVNYGTLSFRVTSIGGSAFYGCTGLTSVTIPNSVTSIGGAAFYGCSNLTSVTIPNSVTSIGTNAFRGCSSLTTVSIYSNSIVAKDYTNPYENKIKDIFGEQVQEYIIGEGVTGIGEYAFSGCSSLTSITIPNSVTSIGHDAFFGCSGLASVTISEGVTSIGSYTFSGCSSLTSITIPNSVTSIGGSAFSGCTGLTSITIPNSVTSIGYSTFSDCSNLASVTIGNGVTSIGDNAFYVCSSLTSVHISDLAAWCGISFATKDANPTTLAHHLFLNGNEITDLVIPESVTSIGSYTFSGCSGLTSVTIPESVTSIGYAAFYECSGLTSVTIPNSVTSIGTNAFRGCSGLTAVTIPSSVNSLGSYTFDDCSGLLSVTINSNNVMQSRSSRKEIFGEQVQEYIIGEGVTSIVEIAFSDCSGLTSITIPSSVTNIAGNAFNGCSNLTTVRINSNSIVAKDYTNYYENKIKDIFGEQVQEYIIGEGVTSIGKSVFMGCTGLTSVTIPSSVTSIGRNAFYDCSSLTSVTISEGVTSIGENAFASCSGLTSITIPNSVTSIGEMAFYGCTGLTSIIISNSVTSIETQAFYSCSGLKSITIPNSVTSIGGAAFASCTGLTSITIPNSVTSIGSNAFGGCTGLTAVTIPNSVTSIGDAAFSSCSGLTSITIPNSVTNIGSGTFYNCSSLTSVNIPNSVTSIGDDAFSYCSGLTSIIIPNSVTSIGNFAFSGCSGLTAITIPNSVTSIGDDAFSYCSGLTSIIIPNSVTSIGNFAFSGCSGLTSVTISESVTSIGNKAFEDCTSLTQIVLERTDPTAYVCYDFYNTPVNQITLYVPKGCKDAYAQCYPWSKFKQIKEIGDEEPVDDHIYIETDLTNQFPTDWNGWTGATGYTATDFAPMVTTNDGRTVQVCEKYSGTIATEGTVFKRTLTGLTNGTYRIELYGAASSTKGRDSKIVSDMTSDNEGDETAVYLYATTSEGTVSQYIPVHWATSFTEVATAVLNEVKVTDGTVEIGMFSEKKYTNWHVVQIKGVTALVDAEELLTNTLQQAQDVLSDEVYACVVGAERTSLTQTMNDNTTVTERTAEAYLTAIRAIESAVATFTAAKESYDKLQAAKELTTNRSYPYAASDKKAAAEAAADAAAKATPTDAADAVSKAEALLTVYRQYAESSAMLEGVEGAEDVTATYILNPKAAEAIDATVWHTVRGSGSGGSIGIRSDEPWTDGSGDTNHRYFDGGNWGSSAWNITFYQSISLPAGHYQLSAMGRSSQDVTMTLFVGNTLAEMAHINATGGLFNLGWEQTSVEFELAEPATVSIGVRGVTSAIHNWMSFSDFRLVQFPKESEDLAQVEGKTFTLHCARGYVYGNGTKLAGTNVAEQASEFAIVTYNNQTYLYDATNKAFAVHTTAEQAGTTGNLTLESKDDFSKAVTGLRWGKTGYESYPFYLEDSFGNWMNMNPSRQVFMNTWKDFEGGVAGNTYAVSIVDTEFDATEAIAMLDAYFNPTATVTYVISDENGVVFTSEPLPARAGAVISELPTGFTRDYCEYSLTPTIVNAGANTVHATVSYSLPFKLSTSFSDAVWYYATIRGTKYLRADENNKDESGRYTTSTTNERTAAYRWAFFGNPYTCFYIANEGAGEGKYLCAGDVPTMQVVNNPTETDAALWLPSANGDGFSLRSITGTNLYINDEYGRGNLGYWNSTLGATDAGSRWMIKEVSYDGIEEIEDGQWTMDNAIYDLNGRRIENGKWTMKNGRLPKGIYIINRKKVLVK